MFVGFHSQLWHRVNSCLKTHLLPMTGDFFGLLINLHQGPENSNSMFVSRVAKDVLDMQIKTTHPSLAPFTANQLVP